MSDEPWTMPEWMEPYRDLFANTGGNSIERLMNVPSTTGRNNVVLAALAVGVESQVILLKRLHAAGLLADELRAALRNALAILDGHTCHAGHTDSDHLRLNRRVVGEIEAVLARGIDTPR